MRIAYTILLMLAISTSLLSQTDFTKQLEGIIKDSTNHFRNFKSGFKETRFTESIPDSIFYTNISVDGTTNNELLISKSEYIFMADVADSLNEINGRKVVDEWRDKIYTVLGSGFTIEEVKKVEWNPSKYGWDFTKGNVTVNINLFPHEKNSTINWIGLAVSVFADEDEVVAKKDN